VDSPQLPVLSDRNWPEIMEKIRKVSALNTASTKSPELLGTGRFRAGLFDLGTHMLQYIFKTIVNYSEKDRFIFFPYAVRGTMCVTSGVRYIYMHKVVH